MPPLVEEDGVVGPGDGWDDGRDRIAEYGTGADVLDVESMDAERGGVVEVDESAAAGGTSTDETPLNFLPAPRKGQLPTRQTLPLGRN